MKEASLMIIGIWVYGIISWVVNLIQFIGSDFASPYKDEIVHAIGVFIPPSAMITVWF